MNHTTKNIGIGFSLIERLFGSRLGFLKHVQRLCCEKRDKLIGSTHPSDDLELILSHRMNIGILPGRDKEIVFPSIVDIVMADDSDLERLITASVLSTIINGDPLNISSEKIVGSIDHVIRQDILKFLEKNDLGFQGVTEKDSSVVPWVFTVILEELG